MVAGYINIDLVSISIFEASMTDQPKIPLEVFETAYCLSNAAWDIGAPQPEIIRLYRANQIKGRVLDLGCGTGDNAFFLQENGLLVTGIDVIAQAIELCQARALSRKLNIEFYRTDILQTKLCDSFDTIIDSGVFHLFSDFQRVEYSKQVFRLLKPGGLLHIICWSELEPGDFGPRRLTRQELESVFSKGWQSRSVVRSRYLTLTKAEGRHSWTATFSKY
jgi:SAM-dependent methyltransferase